MCIHGTFDAHDEFKTDTNGRGTQCTLHRLQESPIKDPASAMIVGRACNGRESSGVSPITVICSVLYACAGGLKEIGIIRTREKRM